MRTVGELPCEPRGARGFLGLTAIVLLGAAGTAVSQPAGEGEALRITAIAPAGTHVPAARQIVIQFNRPVVPIGRMDRNPAEIPIEITPALNCEWRWIDTSALACELGEGEQFRLATRYTLLVNPGITAEDGATLDAATRHEFVTERPRVSYAGFATWQSPGTPVLRAVFTQPVSESSVRKHLFLTLRGDRGRRIALAVEPDTALRELPRFIRLPGERVFIDVGERQQAPVDEQATPLERETARRVWLLRPLGELPLDVTVDLMVEPGLEAVEGDLRGDESRIVVEFATFPEFRFLGVACRTIAGQELVLSAIGAAQNGECNPLGGVGLSFSSPVIGFEIKQHVEIAPDLAGGRSDYDPWANVRDYSQLSQPHERGRPYVVWLPERLKAATPYRIRTPIPAGGPKDEFGRVLTAPIEFAFATSHRPADYTLVHPTAILEQGIDSEVPLYVTNLDDFTVAYRSVTAAGSAASLTRTTDLPDVEDIQYGVALGVREMLGGASGAIYGRLSTRPPLPRNVWEEGLFAAITPYQVHVKLGHFNTLVWVTELATGDPVRAASVSIYVDRLTTLGAAVAPIAEGETDASGIALLEGTRALDPELRLLDYGCAERNRDDCPRLFVRVDGRDGGLALLPLEYRFEVNTYRASNYTVWSQGRPEFGHVHAWGTTAQGVYRAGDTMQFKLYVRDQDNETYVRAPAGPYTLEILDPTGQVVHTVADLTLSEFGAANGTYAIPQNAAVGWYQFRLTGRLGAAESASPYGRPAGSRDPEAEPGVVVRWPMRVLVSDFTPSPFGVATSLSGDLFEAGDEVVADVRATLFSGGPYIDAETRMTAHIAARAFRSEHPVAAPFHFDSTPLPRTVAVAQAVGRVDAEGELIETFRVPPELGTQIVYGRLSVEGAVRDDRGRYVAATASADFVAVDRLVGLRPTQWVFREDEPADVEYLVVDADGAPAAGTDVTIDIHRLETTAARVRGAGNAFLTQFIDEWVPAGACTGRSAEAPLRCTFVPEMPGSYRLTATIHDTQGRAHTTAQGTWVTGVGQVVWRDQNDDALEIVPERTDYRIGDTARYLIKNPYPGARALITIERYGTLEQWVETLDGSTPIIEFAVEKDFMPGFYLSVLVMSPRVAAPPPEHGELDLGKPAFKIGYVAVPVADPYKEIDVRVTTEAAVYKPRDTVRVQVRASPREREQREPIEVAVAVLDEAVLDLIQGGTAYFDPYRGFYTLDGLDMHNYGLLTRLVGRQRIELKGANAGGDGGAAFGMRSLFKYVSYWNPSVRLDARGRGELEFEVPDNLTGWRVLVLATTPTDRLGLGQASFKVNLPTEVRPAMPNQVTEGDQFDAAFSVMNRTDAPRDIRVRITATGGVVAPAAHEEIVHLEPFARTNVEMRLEAARVALDRDTAAGRIELAVTAEDAVDGDGLTHTLVVNKRRSLVTAAHYGSLDAASATESLRFPQRIQTDVGDVGIQLAPSVIGNVDGAFRYLRDYPYTCWEQRLTQGVMAAHYVALRDYLPEDLEWAESAALPAEILAQAASFQAPNGGMTYYVPLDAYVSPYLSAYTALAFDWLRDAGHAIPEAVETRLDEYLDAFLKRDIAPDFYTRGMASTVRAVALAALAKRGKLALVDVARYREHVEYMSLFGKAHYLQAALAVEGGQAIAREVEQIILQSAVRSGGKIAFNEVLDDGYLRISATPLNSSCAILTAVTNGALAGGEIGFPGDAPFELVRTITQARGNRDHWENTQENMFCANALLDYARRFETVVPSMQVAVDIDGEPIGGTQFSSVRDPAVTISRPITAADLGKSSALAIERSGVGRLYYSARMSYAPSDDAATAVNAGVDLRKEFSVERDGEWVLLTNPLRIRRGELVRVDLYVSLPTARNFLVVDDPVPGGLEPVNRDLANVSLVDAAAGDFRAAGGSWWFRYSDWRNYGASRWSFYHQELRHDAVRFYSDYLPPGNYHLSYTAQAIAVGEFTSMPTRAVEMYDPDVYGRGLPATLIVEEIP